MSNRFLEVGKRAIGMGGSFDAAVDAALDQLLNAEMGARPHADTQAALGKVKPLWLTGLAGRSLARRNFEGLGWMAAMPFDAGESLPWLSPTVFEPQSRNFTYEMKREVNGARPTLATMQATTNALRTTWLAAHPGGDQPPL